MQRGEKLTFEIGHESSSTRVESVDDLRREQPWSALRELRYHRGAQDGVFPIARSSSEHAKSVWSNRRGSCYREVAAAHHLAIDGTGDLYTTVLETSLGCGTGPSGIVANVFRLLEKVGETSGIEVSLEEGATV